jgi:hypothetical protein
VGDGGFEGIPALGGEAADGFDGLVGKLPFERQRLGRLGHVAKGDEAGEQRRPLGVGVVGRRLKWRRGAGREKRKGGVW